MHHLGCGEKDFLGDVSDRAGCDPQANTWEDVRIVPLTGMECPTIGQGHGVKWAAAGKDASALQHNMGQKEFISGWHLTK